MMRFSTRPRLDDGRIVLADHLGSGDYAITRAAFAVVLLSAIGAAVLSIRLAKGWTRVIGLAMAATLAFAAARMHTRWEGVTDAADRLTGPSGGQIRLGELAYFLRHVLGGNSVIATLSVLSVGLIALAAQGRRHLTSADRSST
jgi:hypothetical protein